MKLSIDLKLRTKLDNSCETYFFKVLNIYIYTFLCENQLHKNKASIDMKIKNNFRTSLISTFSVHHLKIYFILHHMSLQVCLMFLLQKYHLTVNKQASDRLNKGGGLSILNLINNLKEGGPQYNSIRILLGNLGKFCLVFRN